MSIASYQQDVIGQTLKWIVVSKFVHEETSKLIINNNEYWKNSPYTILETFYEALVIILCCNQNKSNAYVHKHGMSSILMSKEKVEGGSAARRRLATNPSQAGKGNVGNKKKDDTKYISNFHYIPFSPPRHRNLRM